MKKVSLLLIVFLLMGCTKRISFDVPSDEMTIYKNVTFHDSCFDTQYDPLILDEDLEKEALINHINSWKLVENEDQKSLYKLCGIPYSITLDHHNIDIISISDDRMTIIIDGDTVVLQ